MIVDYFDIIATWIRNFQWQLGRFYSAFLRKKKLLLETLVEDFAGINMCYDVHSSLLLIHIWTNIAPDRLSHPY